MIGNELTREKRLEKITKRRGRKETKVINAACHDPAFSRHLPIYSGPEVKSVVPSDRSLTYSWVQVRDSIVSVLLEYLTYVDREVEVVIMGTVPARESLRLCFLEEVFGNRCHRSLHCSRTSWRVNIVISYTGC